MRPSSRPRPESARPRSRPRPKICYETETKNYETETETETETAVQSSQLHVKVTQIAMFLLFYYTHEVNDEPEMDFAFKMISK